MTRRYTRAEFEQVFNHMFGELMPGATPQGIHELSTTQRYQIGSRLELGNKVYHYALVGVGGTGLESGLACKVRNQQEIALHGLPAAGAVVAGSWNLTITVAAGDGPAQSGVIPANYLRGGAVVVRPPGTNFNRGILGSSGTCCCWPSGFSTRCTYPSLHIPRLLYHLGQRQTNKFPYPGKCSCCSGPKHGVLLSHLWGHQQPVRVW